MYKLVIKIATISLLMSFAEVFVIRWIRKLLWNAKFTPFQCALVHLVLSFVLGIEAYFTFNILLTSEGLSAYVIVLFWLLILGLSQIVYDNYNKIEKMMIRKISEAIKYAQETGSQETESQELESRKTETAESDTRKNED